MAPNLYLVFSKPPEGLPPEEYDRWYDLHVRENIVSPGFASARRYELEPSRDEPVVFSHLALYEYEGDMSTWRTDLTRRIETGGGAGASGLRQAARRSSAASRRFGVMGRG